MSDQKLSKLAIKTEVTIRKVLDSIARDIDAVEKAGFDPKTGRPRREARYSLTDFMKLADRALKLEAIRLSVSNDEEGDFFKNASFNEGAEDEPEAD